MQISPRIAEIPGKVTGGGYFFDHPVHICKVSSVVESSKYRIFWRMSRRDRRPLRSSEAYGPGIGPLTWGRSIT